MFAFTRLRRSASSALARDTSWALTGEALTIIVLTLSFTLLGRQLGTEGYGAFVGLYGLIGPAISINQSAVGLAIYEHVVGDAEDPRAVGSSCFTSTVLIGLLLSGLIVGLGIVLLPALPLNVLILFALSELVFTSLLMMAIALIQAARSFVAATQLRILATVARGTMIVGLAGAGELTLRNLAIGQIVVAFVVYAVVARQIARYAGGPMRPGRPRWSTLKSIGTYATGIAATSVQLGGDKVVLNSAGHVSDAGLYGAAYRVILMAQVPANALVNSTHLSFLDRANRDPVRLCMRYSMIAGSYALVATAGLLLFAPLIPLLLGSEFEGAVTVMSWLAPIVLLGAITPFPANALLTYDKNALRTRILVANAVFSVGLYVALIPPFSWRGAVVAAVLSELTMMVATWTALLLVRRRHRTRGQEAPVEDSERSDELVGDEG